MHILKTFHIYTFFGTQLQKKKHLLKQKLGNTFSFWKTNVDQVQEMVSILLFLISDTTNNVLTVFQIILLKHSLNMISASIPTVQLNVFFSKFTVMQPHKRSQNIVIIANKIPTHTYQAISVSTDVLVVTVYT